MLVAEAGCVFMGFMLYISGVQGNNICALKGSTVDLHCSDEHSSAAITWFTEHEYEWSKISADSDHQKYIMSSKSHPTLTIKDLRENDTNTYCCSDSKTSCWMRKIQLHVADLQVKVIPSTQEHKVSLVCNISCALSENPAVYIWYRNRETVYEDWSPWYQELVSSEKGVTYSCAVKGYEHLRAPEVSVDSVTSACFTVTYAEGRMCSHRDNESCSITYPKKVHVQIQQSDQYHRKLICNSSCSLINQQTAFSWYRNRQYEGQKIQPVPSSSTDIFSCAVKDHGDLLSDEICLDETLCRKVHYSSRKICALKGSSVNISSEHLCTGEQQTEYWLKKKRSHQEKLLLTSPRTKYQNSNNHHILTINELNQNDSAEYIFMAGDQGRNRENIPGVTLVITDLSVQFDPSAVVTEGQRVTVTCRTSCPLADDTNYIWYLNNQTLNLTKRHNKCLALDPVSSQHEGTYFCAIETLQQRSDEKVLTVHSRTWIPAVFAVVAVTLVLITATAVFLWRRKITSRQSSGTETSDNKEQINLGHEYDNISAPPPEQAELVYSIIHFPNPTDVLYSTVKPQQLI